MTGSSDRPTPAAAAAAESASSARDREAHDATPVTSSSSTAAKNDATANATSNAQNLGAEDSVKTLAAGAGAGVDEGANTVLDAHQQQHYQHQQVPEASSREEEEEEKEEEEEHETPLLAPTTTYEEQPTPSSSSQLKSSAYNNGSQHNDDGHNGHHHHHDNDHDNNHTHDHHHHHHDNNIEAAGHDDPSDSDEFSLTEGYETRSTGSTSATSSIYAHTYEHGRRYQSYKNSRYPIPNDDAELSREDMKHAMLLELLDGQLALAPIGKNPQHILDIGTGTGIWAIDAGDRWPMARVRGMDISPVQPLWVPPNVDFLVDDCEREWLVRGEVDYAHFRFMATVLKDLEGVLRHAYDALKPLGWIEFQELNCEVHCDDGTMPANDPVKVLYDLTQQAFAKFNMNITIPKILRSYLANAGFVNIQCVVKKVPIGVWAKDKTLRLVGMYQKMAILEIMQALAGRPFDALGLDQVQKEVIMMEARKGLDNPRVHRYFNYYFWFAQKPQ
ncbi:S-adenosyl-L-methionine-dependent methyltransferase [Sordaria brevicollis]|uniref:S-adenosyl-L-methionine-dependent methyltransferase n=1 Tax=Sordaria brevicollis TaxID=83679 RepID=A0AAE0NV83_SORBR|nr:S-adenosyl-L-methionine-dependent methyltransferase [Sordaria brevicollis]